MKEREFKILKLLLNQKKFTLMRWIKKEIW